MGCFEEARAPAPGPGPPAGSPPVGPQPPADPLQASPMSWEQYSAATAAQAPLFDPQEPRFAAQTDVGVPFDAELVTTAWLKLAGEDGGLPELEVRPPRPAVDAG